MCHSLNTVVILSALRSQNGDYVSVELRQIRFG